VLDLADWAGWLVLHWQEWVALFWQLALGWIHIRVPKEVAPTLSFLVFTLAISIGLRMRRNDRYADDREFGKTLKLFVECVGVWLLSIPVALVALGSGIALISALAPKEFLAVPSAEEENHVFMVYTLCVIPAIGLFFQGGYVISKSPHRVYRTMATILYLVFIIIIVGIPAVAAIQSSNTFALSIIVWWIFVGSLAVLAVIVFNSAGELCKRFTFLAAGLLILLALKPTLPLRTRP
jgi:hypothetical protein